MFLMKDAGELVLNGSSTLCTKDDTGAWEFSALCDQKSIWTFC